MHKQSPNCRDLFFPRHCTTMYLPRLNIEDTFWIKKFMDQSIFQDGAKQKFPWLGHKCPIKVPKKLSATIWTYYLTSCLHFLYCFIKRELNSLLHVIVGMSVNLSLEVWKLKILRVLVKWALDYFWYIFFRWK